MSSNSLIDPKFIYKHLSKLTKDIVTDPLKVLKNQHLYAAIGFLSLLPLARNALRGLFYSLQARSLQKIAQRYKSSSLENDNSWVVVTGATAGLGKAYCVEFIKLGFNIVAISRDATKLEALKSELLALNDKSKVKTIEIDFTKTFSNSDLLEKAISQLEGLDISVLINNVGLGECYAFHELNSKKIYNILHTNIYPQVYLTRALMPNLIERSRTRKTAIINLSSNMGTEVFLPYFSVYSATKAFDDYFSKALAREYPNIDILSSRPGRTKTQMNPNGKVTAEKQVKATLRFLGVKDETTGTFRSWCEANLGPSLYWLVKGVIRKSIKKTYETKYRDNLIQASDLPL